MKHADTSRAVSPDFLTGSSRGSDRSSPRKHRAFVVSFPHRRHRALWVALFCVVPFLSLSACGGGGQVHFEGEYPILGSQFPTTLLIPASTGGDQALAQTASQPLIGTFRFYLDIFVPPPMRFEYISMKAVLQGIPDGLALEEEAGLAFVTTSGFANEQSEGVWVFDPADSFRFLDAFTYGGKVFPLPRPAFDTQGAEMNAVQPKFTSGTALVGDKLYISTSNYIQAGINPVCAPGTVWIVGYGGTKSGFHSSEPEGVIITSGFNPTEVSPFTFTDESRDPSHTYRTLLVTNTGMLTIEGGNGVPLTDGSVDVVDPEHDCIVASYPLGYGAPAFSRIAVARQAVVGGGTVYRGYLGSAGYNHVYELDLNGLDNYLGTCPEPEDVPQLDDKVLAGPELYGTNSAIRATKDSKGSPNEVVQVAVNHDGTRAYATGFNTGTLAVLELSTEASRTDNPDGSVEYELQPSPKDPLTVIQVTDPMPSLNETGPGPLAVRPGVPGTDFQGPDVFVLTGTPNGEMRPVQTY